MLTDISAEDSEDSHESSFDSSTKIGVDVLDEGDLKLSESVDTTATQEYSSGSSLSNDSEGFHNDLMSETLRHRKDILRSNYEENHDVQAQDTPKKSKQPLLRRAGRHRVLSFAMATFVLWLIWVMFDGTTLRTKRSARQVRRIIRTIEQKYSQRQQTFSIILKGSRIDLLHLSLDHHANCPSVGNVRIMWQGDDSDIPDIVMSHPSGKLTSTPITTNAVFLLHEGIHFTCRELQRGFREWQHDPVRIVGLLPAICGYVSEQAAFVHKLLVDATPVLAQEPCQPLALSAYLSSVSSKPSLPILTHPRRLVPIRKDAVQEQAKCISDLSRLFGPAKNIKKTFVGRFA